MSYYGAAPVGNRPGCWGDSRVYDSENRECRGCGFQNSCREQVVKITMNRQQPVQQVTTPSYSHQFPTSPYAQPVQLPIPVPIQMMSQPAPIPVPVQRFQPQPPMPIPMPPPAQYQRPVQQQPSQHFAPQSFSYDWYGRHQDPLYFTITTSPPPFRPQMEGETFVERVLKNLILDMGSIAAFHIGLALRQMFLPPKAQQIGSSGQVVDGVVQRAS